jgi:hypothetical protein
MGTLFLIFEKTKPTWARLALWGSIEGIGFRLRVKAKASEGGRLEADEGNRGMN